MRLLLSIFAAMLMVQSADAQALWRNYWTTNRYPVNASILTNIPAGQLTGTIAPSQIATNAAAANKMLYATSATSAKWDDAPTGSSSGTFLIGGSIFEAVSSGMNAYHTIFGAANTSTTDAAIAHVMPVSCYVTNLYFRIAPGLGAGTNIVITLYTNGVASSLTANVNGSGTSTILQTSDTTHSVTVAAGTLLSAHIVGNNASASANQRMSYIMRCVP